MEKEIRIQNKMESGIGNIRLQEDVRKIRLFHDVGEYDQLAFTQHRMLQYDEEGDDVMNCETRFQEGQ